MPTHHLPSSPSTNSATVQSSALTQVAYDEQQNALRVTFRDGRVYEYSGVPLAAYHDLLRADSKGAHFNRHIRNRFRGRIIEGPCVPRLG
jgi:hypothetical protein